ncbi:MAG: hypothetical protein WBM50_09120, partial [Acidimicrobiales bacterium]
MPKTNQRHWPPGDDRFIASSLHRFIASSLHRFIASSLHRRWAVFASAALRGSSRSQAKLTMAAPISDPITPLGRNAR